MDTPGATWKRHGRTWGGMCGPKAGYPYYLGPKVLKRHGYTHHRQGPLSCVRCILPARKTETQGKLKKLLVSGSVYICALIMMAVQQTCRPQWVMLAACLAWVTTLSSRSGVKALSPHPTFDKLNVFLHPSLYVDVERLGDGVESHWWITRAKKAPWPPVLRDSTIGNQEATLPRSESAGAWSYIPFSRVVGNGFQLFRINIIYGIFC